MQHIQTVNKALHLEIGYAGEIGLASLSDAIIEAMENGGVIDEAGIVYIKASSPHERLEAVELWAPEADPEEYSEPPKTTQEDSQPEPN